MSPEFAENMHQSFALEAVDAMPCTRVVMANPLPHLRAGSSPSQGSRIASCATGTTIPSR